MLSEKKKSGAEDDENYQWIEKFQIIECLGCENVSFLKLFGDNHMFRETSSGEMDYYEDAEIFPPYLPKGSELKHTFYLPDKIKQIYIETINSFKVKAFLLTAGGLRAVIEAVCNHLKIKKDNLEVKIDALHLKGYLSKKESQRLHSIRFLGNDALHEMEIPKKEQLGMLLDIVNHLLNNLFISDKIIKGQVATTIDDYEDFKRLVHIHIKKDMLGSLKSIETIIGKSKRLIPKQQYSEFLEQFADDVKEGKFSFIETTEDEKVYKITGEPAFSFDWDNL